MKTVTFDIETISPDWKDEEKFPPLPYHRPVVISMLIDPGDSQPPILVSESVTDDKSDEHGVIGRIVSELAQADRIISYNGRHFDLPVIMLRAAAHGINASGLQDRAHRFPAYRNPLWHYDLADLFTNYGAGTRFSLDQLCSMVFDLPGKPTEIDGSKVEEAWKKDPSLVVWYCEDDVLQTRLCYLHWMLTGEGVPRERLTASFLAASEMLKRHRSQKAA